MTFEDLNLHQNVLDALLDAGYSKPTEIQSEAIPKVLEGHDIRASAQTGTGKTAAFLLPIFNRLVTSKKQVKGPRVLILVPTRELAQQIETQARKYSKFLPGIKTVCVVGGVPYHKQSRDLSRKLDVLIATPGRLIDFMKQRKVDCSNVEMLILDEADRMLDMGFVEPVEQIASATSPNRQTLLFSATLEKSIIRLSKKLMKNPIEISIHAKGKKHENIEQILHYVDNIQHKNRLLEHVLSDADRGSAIVFTATKRHARELSRQLMENGHKAAALHGDMSQRDRTRTIDRLRREKVNVLVATDVAARGIDVQSITHVINFDLPTNTEDYVHRIGRTGRAGAKGTALSFAAMRDGHMLSKIQNFTGQKINIKTIAGLEPSLKKAAPHFKKGGGGAPFHSKGKRHSANKGPFSKNKKFRRKPSFSKR